MQQKVGLIILIKNVPCSHVIIEQEEIFYALLSVAAVNSHILLNIAVQKFKMSRRSLIKKISLLLIK